MLMKKYFPFLRSLAGLIAFVFALTSSAQAQPALPPHPADFHVMDQNLIRIQIPEHLGHIESQIQAAPDNPFVIYIQDAHAIEDAQNRIHSLILYLQETYSIKVVALEGAQGKLDPTLFRNFPDERVKKKIMNQYLEKGELSGVDMAAIMNPQEATYFGIEDWSQYAENYRAFQQATQNQAEILTKLNGIEQALDEERRSVYSPELNQFHEQVKDFREEKITLVELLKYMTRSYTLSFPRKPESEERYPRLVVLLKSINQNNADLQKILDRPIRQMADAFRNRFLFRMKPEQQAAFNRQYQEYRTGEIDHASFLNVLIEIGESVGMRPQLIPEMEEVLSYHRTLSAIKGTQLYDELQGWLQEIEDGLVIASEQKELAGKYRQLRLLRDLAQLELTPDQWEELKCSPNHCRAGLNLPYSVNGKNHNHLNFSDDILNSGLLQPALNFYRLALARDETFHRNLTKLLKKEKADAAIVVAGGFHSRGFEQNLKQAAYSYAVIAPKIGSLVGQDSYGKVMRGDLSYKHQIKTTYYDGFARHATSRLAEELNVPEFRRNLKVWRDNIIRQLAREGRLEQAGEYTRYLDSVAAVYGKKYGSGVQIDREGMLKAMDKELHRFKEDTLQDIWKRFNRQVNVFTAGLRSLIENKQLTPENLSHVIDRTSRVQTFTLGIIDPLATENTRIEAIALLSPTVSDTVSDTAVFRSEMRSRMADLPEGLSEKDKEIADRWKKRFIEKFLEMTIQGSQAGYAPLGISRFYEQLNLNNPIFDPGIFAREFRSGYPDPEEAKPVFNYVIHELGQGRYVSIFWDAYTNRKYGWFLRDTSRLETKQKRLDYLSAFPQIRMPEIHMDLVEHENTELGFIPENEIDDLKEGAKWVNRWIQEGHVIDRFQGDFVYHVRQIHAQAARSLRGTSINENGISNFRFETVETNLRPLIYPWPNHIEALLLELDERVRSQAFKAKHPVLQAAEVYMRLRDIHPFPDGNERTAKLVMNYYLMRNHLPPLQLTPVNREEFIAMTRFMKRPEEFADFLADQSKKQIDFYKTQGDLLPYLVSPEDTLKNHTVIFQNSEEIYHAVADEIQALIQNHRKSPEGAAILIAWGGTMREFFKGEFSKRAGLEKTDPRYLDLSKLKIVFGTEIVKSRAQYLEFLREVVRKLPKHNRLKLRQIIHYDDSRLSSEKAVERFSAQLNQLPEIHLAVMGIGVKGNLGFNARNSAYDSVARTVKLFQSTRSRHNIQNEYAFTVGLSEILKAQKILILGLTPLEPGGSSYYVSKKNAVERAIRTLDVPASAVRFHEAGNFAFYIDKTTANGNVEEGIYDSSLGRNRHLAIVGLNRQEVRTLRVDKPSPRFKVWVQSELSPEEIDVELWSEVIEGRVRSRNWHSIPMIFKGEDPQGYLFEVSFTPKQPGKYEYTIRIAPKNRPILPDWTNAWIWLNGNADNPSLEVIAGDTPRSEIRKPTVSDTAVSDTDVFRSEIRTGGDKGHKGFQGYVLNYGQRNFVASTKQVKNIWNAVKNSLEAVYSQAGISERPARDDFDRFFRILWEAGPRILDPREGEGIPNSVSQFAHEIGIERLPVVVLDPAQVLEQGLEERKQEQLKALEERLAIDAIYLIYDRTGSMAGFVVYALVNGGPPNPVVQQKIISAQKAAPSTNQDEQPVPAVWQSLLDLIGQNSQWRRESGKTVLAHDAILLREGYLKAGWSRESSWKSFHENQEVMSLLEGYFKGIHPKNTPGSRSRVLIFREGMDSATLRRALTYLFEKPSPVPTQSTEELDFAFSRWQPVSFLKHGNERTEFGEPTERNIIVNGLVELDLVKELKSGSLVYEVTPLKNEAVEIAQGPEKSRMNQISSLYDVRFMNSAISGSQGKNLAGQKQDIALHLEQILSEPGSLQRTERKRGEWYPLLSRDVGEGGRASYRLFLYPFDERTLVVVGFFHKDKLVKGKAGYRYLQGVKKSIKSRQFQNEWATPEEGQKYLRDKLSIEIARRSEMRADIPNAVEVINDVNFWLEENNYFLAEPVVSSVIQKTVTDLLVELDETTFKLDTEPVIQGLTPEQSSQVFEAVRGILGKRMGFDPHDKPQTAAFAGRLEAISKDLAKFSKLDQHIQGLQSSLEKLESMPHLDLSALMGQIRKMVKWFQPLSFPNEKDLSPEERESVDEVLQDMAHGVLSGIIENRVKSEQFISSELEDGNIKKGDVLLDARAGMIYVADDLNQFGLWNPLKSDNFSVTLTLEAAKSKKLKLISAASGRSEIRGKTSGLPLRLLTAQEVMNTTFFNEHPLAHPVNPSKGFVRSLRDDWVRSALQLLPEFIQKDLLSSDPLPGLVYSRFSLSTPKGHPGEYRSHEIGDSSTGKEYLVTEIALFDFSEEYFKILTESMINSVFFPSEYLKEFKLDKDFSMTPEAEAKIQAYGVKEKTVAENFNKISDVFFQTFATMVVLHEIFESSLLSLPVTFKQAWADLYPLQKNEDEAGPIYLKNLIYAREDPEKFIWETFADKFTLYILEAHFPFLRELGWKLRPAEREFFDKILVYWRQKKEQGFKIHEIVEGEVLVAHQNQVSNTGLPPPSLFKKLYSEVEKLVAKLNLNHKGKKISKNKMISSIVLKLTGTTELSSSNVAGTVQNSIREYGLNIGSVLQEIKPEERESMYQQIAQAANSYIERSEIRSEDSEGIFEKVAANLGGSRTAAELRVYRMRDQIRTRYGLPPSLKPEGQGTTVSDTVSDTAVLRSEVRSDLVNEAFRKLEDIRLHEIKDGDLLGAVVEDVIRDGFAGEPPQKIRSELRKQGAKRMTFIQRDLEIAVSQISRRISELAPEAIAAAAPALVKNELEEIAVQPKEVERLVNRLQGIASASANDKLSLPELAVAQSISFDDLVAKLFSLSTEDINHLTPVLSQAIGSSGFRSWYRTTFKMEMPSLNGTPPKILESSRLALSAGLSADRDELKQALTQLAAEYKKIGVILNADGSNVKTLLTTGAEPIMAKGGSADLARMGNQWVAFVDSGVKSITVPNEGDGVSLRTDPIVVAASQLGLLPYVRMSGYLLRSPFVTLLRRVSEDGITYEMDLPSLNQVSMVLNYLVNLPEVRRAIEAAA